VSVTEQPAAPAESTRPEPERVPKLVGAAWVLMLVNTLGSQGPQTILPIPRPLIQMITMGAVGAAFVLALVVNPRVQLRPSAYLLMLTVLVVVSFASSGQLTGGLGSLFRSFRFALFVTTLWLLTRWWGNGMVFVRHHVRFLGAVLATVAVGLVVAPGLARPSLYDGRLVGVIWPLTAPQVGQYGAIVAGLVVMLWLSKLTDGRSVALIAGPAVVLLLLSHTRTATLGLVVGLLVAGLSLFLTNARARRAFAWGTIVVGVVAVGFASAVQTWVLRGQDTENFANLTGRQKTWNALLDQPRSLMQEVFGLGLTNKSFNGLPIDSSWLSVYYEQGLVGVALVALFLLTLVVIAALRPPSPARACAVFLIVYCLVSSYTESGLGDASPYLLHLAIAAALLTRRAPAESELDRPQRIPR
jgi:O-antigen ligase